MIPSATPTSATTTSATPTPQITGPTGPTPTAQVTDRVKPREYLAPWREEYAAIRLGSKYFNGIIGGFDQGSGLGFGLEATTADKFSWIELRAMALTSTLLFRRAKLEAYFPHIGSERTTASVWFNYLLATQWNFFGVGPRTPQELRTSFQLEQRSYNSYFQRNFTGILKAGVYAGLANAGATNGNNDNVSNINAFFSGNPAVTPIIAFAPGLNMNTEIFYYGLYGEYDRRNNDRGLTKGFYLYGRLGSYDGLDNGAFFTDFGWLWAMLDGRAYIPLFSDKTSFAARAYASLEDPKRGSQIPFYYQSFIGGRMYVRGFRSYRFRANNALVLSAELRQTVWKQNETRGLDIHAFGDGGQAWGDNRSKTDPQILANDDFSSSKWRFGVGGGFTYRYNRAFAVRIELGHSNESNLVYFSLTRAGLYQSCVVRFRSVCNCVDARNLGNCELNSASSTNLIFGSHMDLVIDSMQPRDWELVQAIYHEGIATGQATFETETPDWERWDAGHLTQCRLVARNGDGLLGWAALSPVSKRDVYAGVAEVSVYVAASARGRGVGGALMLALIETSERRRIWTLQSSIFPENHASVALHLKHGFREVGRRERIARRNGVWRDTVLLERRSRVVGVD